MLRLCSRVLVATVALSLAWAAPARAEDLDPPIIHHTPAGKANKGETVTISAQMEDESEIFAPTLYYRYPGSRGYSTLPMLRKGDAFVATIQVSADIEYWIEAYDEYGNGPTREGTPDRPLRVEAIDRTPVATQKPAPRPEPVAEPTPEPPADPEPVVEENKPAFDPTQALADVKPSQPTQPDPIIAPPPEPAGPRPFYQQWWFYTAAGAVTAAVVTGVVIAAQPDPVYRNTVGTTVGRSAIR